MRRRLSAPLRASRHQRGAVLYIAMILLILMALLGIVGMQVTGLQERMSANYNRINVAFQNAESLARGREGDIQKALFGGTGTFPADEEKCDSGFDPTTWANASRAASATYVRRIDQCFQSASAAEGGNQYNQTTNIYQVSALRGDADSDPAAIAAIDTIFIP